MSDEKLDNLALVIEQLETAVLERVGHQGNRLRELIDDQTKQLHQIDKTLTRNTDSLELHIKRTAQLENRTETIEKRLFEVSGAMKFARAIGWGIGFVLSVLAVYKAVRL